MVLNDTWVRTHVSWAGSLVRTSSDNEYPFSAGPGQSGSSSVHRQRRLEDSPLQLCLGNHVRLVRHKVVASFSSPPGGGVKYCRRLFLKREATGVGVVPGPPPVPVDTASGPGHPD